jgi:hypothetical protein
MLVIVVPTVLAFASLSKKPISIHSTRAPRSYSAVHIDGYDEAFQIIDNCAVSGEATDNLYDAAHFIEKNAHKIYPDQQHKEELFDAAHGSWELKFSTGATKSLSFHKPPKFLPFSFAMIDEDHFGNGFGLNEETIWISLLHNHFFNYKHRQMVVTPQRLYLFGRPVTSFLPKFIRQHLGKSPAEYVDKPPPTFFLIGCSNQSLIARGNKSGGLAIWSRLPHDIREVAYIEHNEPTKLESKSPGLI